MRRANYISRYNSIHSGDDAPPDSAPKYLFWDLTIAVVIDLSSRGGGEYHCRTRWLKV